MTTGSPTPTLSALHLPGVRDAVDLQLADLLDRKEREASERGLPRDAVTVLRALLLGGMPRPGALLCVCGWHAAEGTGDTTALVQVAASLELFHASTLIHDDVMDRSDTRRGRHTAHRPDAGRPRGHRTRGAAARLGVSAAVLVGDLALAWSDELLHSARLPADRLKAVLPLVDAMRTEAVYGQYLDLLGGPGPGPGWDGGAEAPLNVIRHRTVKPVWERPLHIGAAVAGAAPRLGGVLSAFALPLGEASQLRDDLRGVFGDPRRTAAPRLDDLREGKHTVLLALAFRNADPGQRAALRTLVGNPALDASGAARIREVLTATGARSQAEEMIRVRRARAERALTLASLPAHAEEALRRLANAATAIATDS
ncbi:polyprenyl synthetase family protein [Streptomyces sp. NPDC004126]|uniref:polyprenyl synthetase family protein n=1 Tax=Streptomyces sp. NPDC004126 TaxID=3390695 RepID=UPI003D08FA59